MGFWKSVTNIVKVAVVTAAVVYTGGAAAAALGYGTMAAATSMAITAFTVSAVTGALNAAFGEEPDVPDAGSSITGQLITTRKPAEDARVIYGKTRVGGNIVFAELQNDNKDLYMVVTLAGHQVTKFTRVFANDTELLNDANGIQTASTYTSIPYNGKTGYMSIELSDGAESGKTFSLLAGTSGANKTFKGIACMVIKLTYNQDVYAQGIPNFTVEVVGKNSTSNSALAIKDYILDSTYGLGADTSEIDTTSFDAAEATCDELVTLADASTEKRYTVNGAFSSAEAPQNILQKMLLTCSGSLVYQGGKWKLIVGEYRSPTVELTEDEIVGAISVSTSDSRRDTFNAVKGVYSEPTSLYQSQSYIPVTNALYASEDGETIYRNLDFQLVTSNATCQRLAKIQLEKARQQIVVNITCNLKAFQVQVGDTVQLTLDRYGWDQKEFEVLAWNADMGSLSPTVNLSLRETASGVYDWADGEETTADLAENTTLPSPYDIQAPGISISDEVVVIAEKVVTKLIVNVTGDSLFHDRYEVEAKLSTDTQWLNLGQASGNRFELLDAVDGAEYDVRARSISTFGVRSDYETGSHQVVGKTDTPSDVTGLTGNLIGNQYLLTWNAVPDLDLSHYRVRFAAENGENTYQNAISLVPKVSRPATSVFVPARNGTYFVKAVDKLGLASENPATIVLSSNIDELDNFTGIQTVTEHPDFVGSFDDVVEIDEDDRLVLNTSISFDAVTGNFDDAEGLFDGGAGNVDAFGYYYFDDTVDLGAVFLVRAESRVRSTRVDYVVLFDSTAGLFDDRAGYFDGDVNAFDDVDVEVQARITEDDTTGTPTWSDWKRFEVSDFKARGLQFRAKLSTTDDQATPAVSELSVSLYMGEHVESGDDVVSGTSAYSVTFDRPYKVTPAIGIGAQDLQTGDYYRITSKSRTGFTITFYDSTDTIVSRTFDWVAKGYGREVA